MRKFIFLGVFFVSCQCIFAQKPMKIPADSLTIGDVSGDLVPTDTLSIDTVATAPACIGFISHVLIDSVAIGRVVPDTVIGDGLPERIVNLKLEEPVADDDFLAVSTTATHRLFNDEMRTSAPAVVLEYVEAAYQQHFSDAVDKTDRFADITFVAGSWDMLGLVSDSTNCSLSLVNARTYRIVWQDLAEMTFPVQYDRLLGGSRTEIEAQLIARLRQSTAHPHSSVSDSTVVAEVERSDCYTVKGDVYGISQVNRNYYLQVDDGGFAQLVFDSIHPAQSLANLFVCGVRDQQVPMTITIPKHEYGVRDTVQTTVAALDEVCGADGCVAYWGTELLTDDCLRGSVFLYNIALGYDHVLCVECDPRLIGTEQLALTCRMSLFIPTTNVKDLYVTIGPKETVKEAEYE